MKDSFFVRSRRDLNPRAGFCRPTPLAGAPLQPLEYYSSPESSFHMYEMHNELYRRGYRLSNLCIFLYLCGIGRCSAHRRGRCSCGCIAVLAAVSHSAVQQKISLRGSCSGSRPSLPPAVLRDSRGCAGRRSDIWESGAHDNAAQSGLLPRCCSG